MEEANDINIVGKREGRAFKKVSFEEVPKGAKRWEQGAGGVFFEPSLNLVSRALIRGG